MSKILLHTCCAPCTTYVNKCLTSNNFEVTGFFYNPNIFPQEEYQRRKSAMEDYVKKTGFNVVYEKNDSRTLPGECEECYRVRLRKTAQVAKDKGFDYFTTTLLISPYQKHDLLKKVGEELAQEFGVQFFYHDFREGFRQSQQMARKLNLYRQKYCGCGVETIAKEEKVYAQAN